MSTAMWCKKLLSLRSTIEGEQEITKNCYHINYVISSLLLRLFCVTQQGLLKPFASTCLHDIPLSTWSVYS